MATGEGGGGGDGGREAMRGEGGVCGGGGGREAIRGERHHEFDINIRFSSSDFLYK